MEKELPPLGYVLRLIMLQKCFPHFEIKLLQILRVRFNVKQG